MGVTETHGAMVRKSLPLTAANRRDLALIRTSPEHLQALKDMVGVDLDAESSEASFLHAVLEAGMKALREMAEEVGYAQMADERAATRSERQRAARRRRPSWADE